MFCKKCGNEIAMDEKFCPVCGTGVETVKESVSMNENRSGQNFAGMERKKPSASILVAAIIGGIIGVISVISGIMKICM